VNRPPLTQRLAFLALTEEDRGLLSALAPALEENAERFVAAFYRHLLSFEPMRRLLADPEVKDRLLGKQVWYLKSLAGPVIDEAFISQRLHIGRVHERLGLSPRWYLSAYSLYFSLLHPLVSSVCAGDTPRETRTLDALVKLLMLDAQLAIEAYIEAREEQLEYLNRELASASRELAEQVRQRSAELQHTQRRARAAEELASVATLAAGLAHEIGTPMGVIRGHAELLESSVSDEKGRWRLKTITGQIDRISGIIHALLNLARPREPVREPTDLAGVIDSTLTFISEKLRRRGIEVERKIDTVPSVIGDGEKLQQVLLNLYLNAADAMAEGGTLSVSLGENSDGWAEIRVGDTGAGIPENELEHIFEAFYTTKESGQGNGLGLVVTHSIVADHGGTLRVESEPGVGTEFRIALPTAQTEEESVPT
jgi:two-component system sensor histidine kinase HydH